MLNLIFRSTFLLIGLIIAGSILCLPIYKWKIKDFLESKLWTKIIWWVPIYFVFVIMLIWQLSAIIIIISLIITLSLKEFYTNTRNNRPKIALSYLIYFIVVTFSFILVYIFFEKTIATNLLITVFLLSVMSDVTAYFFGTYFSRHKLPKFINPNKSWEGVLGQVVGPFIGATMLFYFLSLTSPWLLTLTIGIASAIGDLFNSIAKRSLGIKDWGQTIPGHGGVLDRMSSLSTALFAALWLSILI